MPGYCGVRGYAIERTAWVSFRERHTTAPHPSPPAPTYVSRPLFELASYTATRYVQPLREGGSLPAVLDTQCGGLFVTKFRGAGQGVKALIGELIVGTLARAAELPTPDLALIAVPSSFGRSEPDPEIQDLLRASHGINVGLRYLDGAFNFDPAAAGGLISPELAARIVWLDAFVTNPDRTHRNSNLLVWNRQPWLIDHGAALYAHHDWQSVDDARTRTPFPFIRDHVLLTRSADLERADASITSTFLSGSVIRDAVAVGPLALAPPSERFHWLTAPRSDVLQSGPVHEGLCNSPAAALSELFESIVAPRAPGA